MYWLDYSAAKLPGETIKNAGYGGVIRYIDAPDRLRTKHTNMSEYQDHIRSGLQVWLVMQNTTTDADGGRPAGEANARRAKAGADYLGYTGPIFFCNDRTTVPNPAAWQAYLDGAASVLGINRVGAYGFANAMELAREHATWFWQSGRRTDLRPHVHFWQDNNTQVTVGGITCDRNLLLKDLGGGDVELTDKIRFWDGFEITVGQALGDTWQLANNLSGRGTRPGKPADTTPWVLTLLAEVTSDPDLTAERIGEIVRENTQSVDPAALAAQLLGPLQETLSGLDSVSPEDAEQIANTTVRKFAEQLGSTNA